MRRMQRLQSIYTRPVSFTQGREATWGTAAGEGTLLIEEGLIVSDVSSICAPVRPRVCHFLAGHRGGRFLCSLGELCVLMEDDIVDESDGWVQAPTEFVDRRRWAIAGGAWGQGYDSICPECHLGMVRHLHSPFLPHALLCP